MDRSRLPNRPFGMKAIGDEMLEDSGKGGKIKKTSSFKVWTPTSFHVRRVSDLVSDLVQLSYFFF